MTKIQIPDISFWNYKYEDYTRAVVTEYVNFEKMRAMVPGVIIRAGQGTWGDDMFHYSWQNAKRMGLLRGSYFFFDSRYNPKRQAEKYCSALEGDYGEMELWCDFEERYGGDYTGWKNWYDFMERIKAINPEAKLGVYTGYYYFNEFVKTDDARAYFGQYPLWIANYNPSPLIPTAWKDYTYWQYTDSADGKQYGSAGLEIDLNYFNGTEEEFYARYGAAKPTTPDISREIIADYDGETVYYKEQ